MPKMPRESCARKNSISNHTQRNSSKKTIREKAILDQSKNVESSTGVQLTRKRLTDIEAQALTQWYADFAARNRATLPAKIHSWEELGKVHAQFAAEFRAGLITERMFDRLLVWSAQQIQIGVAASGRKVPALVIHKHS
jgi:hypothetical protein